MGVHFSVGGFIFRRGLALIGVQKRFMDRGGEPPCSPPGQALASICCNMFKKKQVLQYVLEDLQKKDLEVTREGTSSQLILKNLF